MVCFSSDFNGRHNFPKTTLLIQLWHVSAMVLTDLLSCPDFCGPVEVAMETPAPQNTPSFDETDLAGCSQYSLNLSEGLITCWWHHQCPLKGLDSWVHPCDPYVAD